MSFKIDPWGLPTETVLVHHVVMHWSTLLNHHSHYGGNELNNIADTGLLKDLLELPGMAQRFTRLWSVCVLEHFILYKVLC